MQLNLHGLTVLNIKHFQSFLYTQYKKVKSKVILTNFDSVICICLADNLFNCGLPVKVTLAMRTFALRSIPFVR